jgi:hypothetical protein
VDEFRSQDFGLKLNWEAPGSDLRILFCLQNGTLIRPASTGSFTAVARLFQESICAGESMEEAGSWRRLDLVMRIPVTTY